MKLRITPEQLLELTDEQKQNLRELWGHRKWDLCAQFRDGRFIATHCIRDDPPYELCDTTSLVLFKHTLLPILSIGQMIELLDNIFQKDKSIEHNKMQININKTILWVGNSQLCDALWQAVKAVL